MTGDESMRNILNLIITDFVNGPKMQANQLQEPAMMAQVIERMKIMHRGSEAARKIPSEVTS